MNNELMLKLREKGFEGDFTLESLIEQCGSSFKSLDIRANGTRSQQCTVKAKGQTRSDGSQDKAIRYTFYSPKEAVAYLWLELNK